MKSKKENFEYTPLVYSKAEKRAYAKMASINSKRLRADAKAFMPSDFGFLLNALEDMLIYMREYYSQTTYVLQEDKSRLNIAEQLKTALSLYKDFTDAEDSGADCETLCLLIKKFFSYVGEHILEWWD